MGVNNRLYNCYKRMTEGQKLGGSEGSVKISGAAMEWLSLTEVNPFEPDTEACDCFHRMLAHYQSWKRGGVGSNYSRKQIVMEANKLAALKTKNPYKYDRKEAEQDKAELAAKEEARLKAQQEAELKAIEAEAEKIVQAEELRKQAAAAVAQEKAEREKQEEEAKAEAARKEELLRKAVEAKRAQYGIVNAQDKNVALGVPYEEEAPKKHRFFGWFKKEK